MKNVGISSMHYGQELRVPSELGDTVMTSPENEHSNGESGSSRHRLELIADTAATGADVLGWAAENAGGGFLESVFEAIGEILGCLQDRP